MTARPIRILFVDDEPFILRAIERTLARDTAGEYELFFTTEPREAAEIVGEHHIDIVVSDQNMPHMKGVELMHLLQRFHAKLLRIMISGCADREPMERGLEEGALHYLLEKPWQPAKLRAILAEAAAIVQQRRGERPEPDFAGAARSFAQHPAAILAGIVAGAAAARKRA